MKDKKLFVKIVCFVMCFVLMFALAACTEPGDNNNDGDNTAGDNSGIEDNTGSDNTGGDNTGSGDDGTGGNPDDDNTGDDNTGDNNGDDNTPSLPDAKDWVNVSQYNQNEVLNAYMQPIWHTREVYDETAVIVGADGEATLLYEPNGEKIVVRNYTLGKTYVEGVDYTVEGRTIKRVKGGSLPYFKVDDYFTTSPVSRTPGGNYTIYLNPDECEFDFDEQRYIVFGESYHLTKDHYITISYTTDEAWDGFVPTSQTNKVSKFLNKLQNGEDVTILFYGDSITVGANASGSAAGGMINPYLPTYPELIKHSLEKKYGVTVNVINEAVGAWRASNGVQNFSVVTNQAADVDLLVLAFGMNDTTTEPATFKAQLRTMASNFLSKNPNGSVVLVSTMLPNRQSTLVQQQPYFEQKLWELANQDGSIAVAEVTSMFEAFESRNKRSRDWLANNCKHPNDFGVRIYAQVILKTILGDDYGI